MRGHHDEAFLWTPQTSYGNHLTSTATSKVKKDFCSSFSLVLLSLLRPSIFPSMFRSFCFIAALAATEAFVPSTTGRQNNHLPALGLTVDDGMDLVAASQQMYRRHQDLDANDDHDDDDDDNQFFHQAAAVDDDTVPSVITAPRGAAIAFVKRLFAQPTAAFHPHEAEGLDSYQGESDGDDIVYFPVRVTNR